MVDALDDWIARLSAALDVDAAEVDRDGLLDLARDAAHGIARPAAPVTTFLVGYAAGRRGGGRAAVAEAADIARRLAVADPTITGRPNQPSRSSPA